MARYIKANYKVAEFLHLESERNKVNDGNYLLWQADILPFGPLTQLPAICEQIGAIALMAHEAREEQDGTTVRPLPTATDPRFVIGEVVEEQPDDGGAEADADAEATEEEPKDDKEG